MTGTALREVREVMGWGQKVIALIGGVSESLVKEWEHGRRPITEERKPLLARKVDDGQFYMALARQSSGGPCVAPWLNNIDDHRIVCALKTIEELEEAVAAIRKMMPALLLPPDKIGTEAREIIRAGMLEIIESTTASENTCGRLARLYGISLWELWDQHEHELIEKGYLKKEKPLMSERQR